jgi:hypothetical protein
MKHGAVVSGCVRIMTPSGNRGGVEGTRRGYCVRALAYIASLLTALSTKEILPPTLPCMLTMSKARRMSLCSHMIKQVHGEVMVLLSCVTRLWLSRMIITSLALADCHSLSEQSARFRCHAVRYKLSG